MVAKNIVNKEVVLVLEGVGLVEPVSEKVLQM